MSLPGLVDSIQPIESVNHSEAIQVQIPSKSEWRFEVSFESKVTIRIVSGISEVFGTELSNDVDYVFSGLKYSIYAPVGDVTLEYTGELLSEYISEETIVDKIVNLHLALETQRQTTGRGPRVLLIGNKDTGKTSLARTICSYANKIGRQMVYVNLDPQEGVMAPPGALTATPISDVLEVETGSTWAHSLTTGVARLHPKQPIVKNFGLEKWSDSADYYKECISKLGLVLESRMAQDIDVQTGGAIIDTPAMSIKDVDVISEIISEFNVDILCVLGNERLYIDLKKHYGAKLKAIVKFPTSGGAVERDDVFTRALQRKAIREYFYGDTHTVLSPYTVSVDYADIEVYAPKRQEPIIQRNDDLDNGTSKPAAKQLLEKVEINSSNLAHSLLAISMADRKSSEEVILRNGIMGYGHVSHIDDKKQKLSILLPVPGRLPDKVLFLTEFRYME